jgi:hypothetical protein
VADYTLSAHVEADDHKAGEVTQQFGLALDHLDPELVRVKSTSVWEQEREVIPDDMAYLALEEEVTRLIGVGLAMELGHTMDSIRAPLQPGPNTMRMAREKLEELRNAW